jgi:hypothetical protein
MFGEDLRQEVQSLKAQVEILLQAVGELPNVLGAQQTVIEDEQSRRRALRLSLALICGAIGRTQPQALADIRATIGLLEEQFARNDMPDGATQELRSLNTALNSEDAWPNVDAGVGPEHAAA